MQADAIRKCIETYSANAFSADEKMVSAKARAQLTALEAALQNRNDLLRSFKMAARMTQLAGDASVLARDIVAVVEASDVPEE